MRHPGRGDGGSPRRHSFLFRLRITLRSTWSRQGAHTHIFICVITYCFDKEISRKAIKEKIYNRIKNDDLPPFFKNISKNAKGKKGKVLIVNTADILHRAGDPILNKSRKTFFIQIKSNKEWEDDGFLRSPAQS